MHDLVICQMIFTLRIVEFKYYWVSSNISIKELAYIINYRLLESELRIGRDLTNIVYTRDHFNIKLS